MNNDSLESIKCDLIHQLGIPDELDWDYLAETAQRARLKYEQCGDNKVKFPKTDSAHAAIGLDRLRSTLTNMLTMGGPVNWPLFSTISNNAKAAADKEGRNMTPDFA